MTPINHWRVSTSLYAINLFLMVAAHPLELKPEDNVVQLHSKATFFCQSDKKTTWHANGRRISKARYYTEVGPDGLTALRVEAVRDKDNNTEIACVIMENNNQTIAEARAKLVVLQNKQEPVGFPKILQEPKLRTVEKGSSTTLTCRVSGQPTPSITWLKNTLPIDLSNSRYSTSTLGSQGSLVIQHSEESDEGRYECLVRNEHGVAHSRLAQLYVKVRRVPPYFSRPPENRYQVMPGGDVNLSCVAVGHPMPQVFWRPSSGQDLEEPSKAPYGINNLFLSKLEKSENYTCVAFSDLGNIEFRTTVEVKALAYPPTNVQVAEREAHQVMLTWNRLAASADFVPLHYIVEYRPKYADGSEFNQLIVANRSAAVVDNLDAYTQYEFQLRTVTAIGKSQPSMPVEATTLEAVPENPPKNVHSRAVSPTSVLVQWEAPDKPNGVILAYVIFYTSRPAEPFSMWNSKEVAGHERLTTLGDLHQNVVYTIRIQVRNSAGFGPISEPVSVLTKPGIPGQPQNVKATAIGAKRMLLTWESPLFSSDITNYLIRYNSTPSNYDQVEVDTSKTEKIIQDLLPNTDYSFQVNAKSRRGGSGLFSRPVHQRTESTAPTAAPEGVVVEALGPRQLRVMWEPPPKSEQHGLITSYKIFWEPTEPYDDDDDDDDEDENEEEKSAEQSADRQRSVIIKKLHPFTQYRVSVAAGTVKGYGPQTEPIVVRTSEDVPGAPRQLKVTVLNATSVRVSWQEPSRKNGHLVGYSVFVEQLDHDNLPLSAMPTYPAERVAGEKNETTVNDLKPSANYSIRVNGYNQKGDGLFTKAIIVRMPGLPPSAPKGISTALVEEHPVRLLLKWTEPDNTYGHPVEKYHVRYRTTDVLGAYATLTLEANQKAVFIEPLKNGRRYEFLVAAENKQGIGEEAQLKVTTPTSVPTGAPFNIRYELDAASKQLEFTWEPPRLEERNGEIVKYQTKLAITDSDTNTLREVTENSVRFTVDKLDVKYAFSVCASTREGPGPWSEPLIVEPQWNVDGDQVVLYTQSLFNYRTDNVLSGRAIAQMTVKNVTAQAMSPTSALVVWKPINDRRVQGYKVLYTQEPSDKAWLDKEVLNPAADRVLVEQLKNNAHYAFCAVSECSENAFEIIQPRYVVHELTEEKVRSSYAVIRWLYDGPRPASFYVKYKGKKRYRTQVDEWKELTIDGLTSETDQMSLNITNLRPYTNYTFEVGVIWSNSTSRRYYLPQMLDVTTRKSVPPFISAPVFVEAVNSKEVLVRLHAATEEYGPVSHYWLILVPMDTPQIADKIENKEVLHARTYHPIAGDYYVAARLSREDILSLKDGLFLLGNGHRYGGFTNFPLNTRARYKLFLRAFIDNEGDSAEKYFASSMYSGAFSSLTLIASSKTGGSGSGGSSLWLIGPIVAILVVGIILGIVCIFMFRRSKKRKLPVKHGSINKVALGPIGPSETSKLLKDGLANSAMADVYQLGEPMEMQNFYYPQPPPVVSTDMPHPPIPIIELAGRIERLKANDNMLFSAEYESIETGQHLTWDVSNLECNKSKNRYANVVAYDHSRVLLSTLDNNVPGSDYINANYIDGYRRSKAYIATQGPMATTFDDFWQMVWEQKVPFIVMLTKLEERARVKCDQYWPGRGTHSYGGVHVTIKEVTEFAHYVLRIFQLSKVGETEVRDVRHLQFTAWPDHGVPEHPTPFLIFLKHVKALNPLQCGPIVVHCSAGVGRTGAFVVVDIMLDRLRYENTVDIYGCVASIRSQRSFMVQTEEQYIFIYDAVLDAVQSGCTEVPVSKLILHMETLLQYQPLENATGMQLEFRHLSALKFPNAKFTVANLPCNKMKNRLVNVVPCDSSRVCLASVPMVEGSDYINASYIDGYRLRKMYIAAQGAMANTVEDFWRMLWEHNSNIIVMLTKLQELGREMCCQYWPQDQAERLAYLLVEPVAEYHLPQYVLREFKLSDSRTGQSKTVRHFQFNNWPEQGVPQSSDSLIDFIGQVHKTREQFGQDGPITIHCSSGSGRTAVFIALSIILERIRCEGVVDIFTVVKLLRCQRLNMVQSEDQYHFLHQAAAEYIGSFDQYTPLQC